MSFTGPQLSAVATLTSTQRTGIHTCSAPWFRDYWGFIWGGWWRRPFVTVNNVGYSGCGQWRTVLAFSFMAMFAYLVSTFLVSSS